MSVEWLDRSLFRSPYRIALCLSEKDYQSQLRRLKMPLDCWDRWLGDDQDASLHYFEAPSKEDIAIVTIRPRDDVTGCWIAALLVHEAVHVFQRSMQLAGEEKPSKEFEAYGIQRIAQGLMESYIRQTKRKGNSRRL